MDPVIELKGVSKAFRIVRQRPFLAKELVRKVLQKPRQLDLHWALRDISFTVQPGQSIGVIGNNGSGKSTLLSLIAKTSYPTAGSILVRGRVGPMLELGAGFHYDLTGLENIFLNASLLGMGKADVESKLDAIIEYSGLGEFIHSPLTTYSTGMSARLGFAIIAHLEPDILLVDEVLAVGDVEFQSKCQATIIQFLKKGATLFLVSHNMLAVQTLCKHSLWIDQGRLRKYGPTDQVIAEYLEARG